MSAMPKYKKRDPEFTAIQFTGDNIGSIIEELGPEFRTNHKYDLKGATSFNLEGHGWQRTVRPGEWIVVDPGGEDFFVYGAGEFSRKYEPIRKAGRPPKEKA